MAWTFLRDNLYLEFMDHMVGEDGVIRGPAGDGRAAVVSHDDIARVAVAVLLDPASHAGRTYDLTGPGGADASPRWPRSITEVTGREVRFHDETLEEAYASRAVYGAPGLAGRRLGVDVHRGGGRVSSTASAATSSA